MADLRRGKRGRKPCGERRRTFQRWALGSAFVLSILCAIRAPLLAAEAQERQGGVSEELSREGGADTEPAQSGTTTEAGAASPKKKNYWEAQPSRLFAFSQVMLGAVNLGQFGMGYGKPNWIWVGASGGGLLAPGFGTFQASLHGEILLINVKAQYRRVMTFSRHFSAEKESYVRGDFKENEFPRSHYSSFAVQLWGFIPVGPTLGMWSVTGEIIRGVPSDLTVFSEHTLMPLDVPRSLMPALVWWWMVDDGKYMVGPAMDWTMTPGRNVMFRLGPSLIVNFGHHLSFQLMTTLPVVRPDSLGFVNQIWGTAGLSWKWASGEPEPGFL